MKNSKDTVVKLALAGAAIVGVGVGAHFGYQAYQKAQEKHWITQERRKQIQK